MRRLGILLTSRCGLPDNSVRRSGMDLADLDTRPIPTVPLAVAGAYGFSMRGSPRVMGSATGAMPGYLGRHETPRRALGVYQY
jgi:hypothetical protein